MKLKMKEVLGIDQVITSISKQKLPIALAYKMSKIRKSISGEVQFAQSKTTEYINLYAQRENGQLKIAADGKSIVIQHDKITECNDKLAELDNMEVEIPDMQIKMVELAGLNFTIDEMTALLPILEE